MSTTQFNFLDKFTNKSKKITEIIFGISYLCNTEMPMKKFFYSLFALALFCAIAFVVADRNLSRLMVAPDITKHFSWAIVLDGQSRDMQRTDAAVNLLKNKQIDSALISGTRAFKNHFLSEYYVRDMLEQSADSTKIFQLWQNAFSTRDEAREAINFFRSHKIDTVAIITSAYHTIRAARIFNQISQNKPYFIAIPVHTLEINENNVFHDRTSRINTALELCKHIHSWYENWKDPHPDLRDFKVVPATETAK
jgi:uncharacterized SAM-binding protein YcdF (DUF218 family)